MYDLGVCPEFTGGSKFYSISEAFAMEMKNCTAGYACLDITPPLGTAMIGAGPRTVKGVFDPLYVRAVAFGEGDKSAVLLVCDLLGMYGKFGHSWPGQIAEELGLEKDSVILCCTHTHTGPSPASDKQYFAWLYRRLKDAAQMALDDRKSVTDVCWAEGEAPKGTAQVRRYVMKDGSITTHPVSCNPETIRHVSAGDNSIRVVRILREGGEEIALVNFQTHPDNVGGEFISADYPGMLCRRIEEERDNVRCVFLDGAEGQLVRNDKLHEFVPKSLENTQAYADVITDAALPLFEQTESTGMEGLHFAQKTIEPKSAPEGTKGWDDDYPEVRPLIISTMVFCGLALVGIPGEPYYEMGTHIRGYSKFPVTCVICQANGSHGYYPMLADFGHPGGSYEPNVTHVAPGTAEQMVVTAEEMLRAF